MQGNTQRSSSVPQHGFGDIAIDQAGGDKLVHRHELVRLVGNGEIARANHRPLRAELAKMHEVATTLEAEGTWPSNTMGAARSEARLHDRSINGRLRGAAGRWLIADDLGADAEALIGKREQISDFALDRLLVLAGNHPAIEQKIARAGQHVVGG